MMSLKVTQPLIGKKFCMAMLQTWVNTRSLLCCLTKLHVTCMNFMLSLMPPMDFLLCQLTEAVLVCMGSSSQLRYTDFISQKKLDYLWYLFCFCYLQNRALLATLRKIHATGGKGHIALFNTLAIGNIKHANEQRISCHPFAKKQLRGANRQDFVFIRPPGISHGAFALRMDNSWFCKVLVLFQIDSNTDLGWKRHSCAFVSVLEEYTGARRPGNSIRLLTVLTVLMHIDVI
jgi:hypothetical protein